MSSTLWDKGAQPDQEMMRFTARDDWQLDQRLLIYDLRATLAHVRGLFRIGVLDRAELLALEKEILGLVSKVEENAFVLSPADEDGHSAIEEALVKALGDIGKKVHTGRSRNDQVLVALRLYERDALDSIIKLANLIGLTFLGLAKREMWTPMPGYTHLQRAMPSSLGFWAASFAENIADAMDFLAACRPLINRCPLGGAAGFGVNLPLDREGVAKELGFDGIFVNAMAIQSSRGMTEASLLSALWALMAVLRRFAWDLSLFTTGEFGFLRLPEAFTTGSSIMPQKRNPDVVELLRAGASVVQGALLEVQSLVALPPGYHRDLQLTKAPVMRALDETVQALRLIPRLIEGLVFDRERMKAAIGADCLATDRAIDLVRSGVPFREAYKSVALKLDDADGGADDGGAQAASEAHIEQSLRARVSPGAPGDLRLGLIEMRFSKENS